MLPKKYILKKKNILFLTNKQKTDVFCSVQDGIYALGKAHMRSTPSLRTFPNAAYETVPVIVRLTMTLSRPFKEDLSTPISSPPVFFEKEKSHIYSQIYPLPSCLFNRSVWPSLLSLSIDYTIQTDNARET